MKDSMKNNIIILILTIIFIIVILFIKQKYYKYYNEDGFISSRRYLCDLKKNNGVYNCTNHSTGVDEKNGCTQYLGGISILNYCRVCNRLNGNININPKARSIHDRTEFGNPTCTCPKGYEFDPTLPELGKDGKLYMRKGGKLKDELVKVLGANKQFTNVDLLNKYKCKPIDTTDRNYILNKNNINDCVNIVGAPNPNFKNTISGLWSEKENKCYAYETGSLKLPDTFDKNDNWYIKTNNDPFWIKNNVKSLNDSIKQNFELDKNNIYDCVNIVGAPHPKFSKSILGLWSGAERICYAYENGSLKLPKSFNKNNNWYIKTNDDPFWRNNDVKSLDDYKKKCLKCNGESDKIYFYTDNTDVRNFNESSQYIQIKEDHDVNEEIPINTGRNHYKFTYVCMPFGYVGYLNGELNPLNKNYYLLTTKNCEIPLDKVDTRRGNKFKYETVDQHSLRIKQTYIKEINNLNKKISNIKTKLRESKSISSSRKNIIKNKNKEIKKLEKEISILEAYKLKVEKKYNNIKDDIKDLVKDYSKYINDLMLIDDNKEISIKNNEILIDNYNKIDEKENIILYTDVPTKFINISYNLNNGNVVMKELNNITKPYYLYITFDPSLQKTIIESLLSRLTFYSHSNHINLGKRVDLSNEYINSAKYSNIKTNNSKDYYKFKIILSKSSKFKSDFELLNNARLIITNQYQDKLYESSLGKWIVGNNNDKGYIIRKNIDKQWNLGLNVNNEFPMNSVDNKYTKVIQIPNIKNMYSKITNINVPLQNMQLEILENNNKIKYLRNGKHQVNYDNKSFIKSIIIKNTPPERNNNEILMVGDTKSFVDTIKTNIDNETKYIDKIKQDNIKKSEEIEQILLNKKQNLCKNLDKIDNVNDEIIKKCMDGFVDKFDGVNGFSDGLADNIVEGFDDELKIKSLVNADEISIIPQGSDKFNVQINGKCLTVYGDKDYKLNDCVKTTRQQFKKSIIKDKYDSKNIIGKLGSDNVNYPYEVLSSEITNSCLTIDPDGISVQPCIPDNKKQHWISSMNSKQCVMNER